MMRQALHRLALILVPEARPRSEPLPPPPAELPIPCDCEREAELAKAESEFEHAKRANELALMSATRTSHALVSAEERSRRMLAGLMDRMDKGTEQ